MSMSDQLPCRHGAQPEVEQTWLDETTAYHHAPVLVRGPLSLRYDCPTPDACALAEIERQGHVSD